MNQLFLYRLLKHSRPAFVFAVLFIICFSIVFYKKMDMLLFPYNSMYTMDFTKSNTAATYAMKVNGNMISITKKLYWKKDLLETALYGYCNYIQHYHTVPLDNYLKQRSMGNQVNKLLSARLTPDSIAVMDWPHWYIGIAGYDIPAKAGIELMQYNFRYDDNKAVLTDSISIYKTILP